MERHQLASIGAAALLVLCWISWLVLFLGSDPDMLALCRTEAAATIEPAEPSPPLRIAVFTPAGEDSGELDKVLRARFADQSGWKVLDRDLQEEALRDYGAKIQPKPKSAKEALEAGTKLGVEAAFWAHCKSHRKEEGRVEVDFEWGLIRVPSGDGLANGSARREKSTGFFAADRYRARVDGTSAVFRIFLWLLTVLALPVALVPLTEPLFRLRRNELAAAVLAAYAVIGFTSMLVLNGFRLVSVLWGILALLAIAGTALYSLAVLNALNEE